PFGGKERKEVQQNFDIKTSETASLFLQHFIKSLKAGGRAGIVIKQTFLTNSDNASAAIRKYLLESCNLHTILDMPKNAFLGTGEKTVVLFFTKGVETQKIWAYQLATQRTLGKTSPLNDDDMTDFLVKQKNKELSENSWTLDIKYLDPKSFIIDLKNPSKKITNETRSLEVILSEIETLEDETSQLIDSIRELI
ncbi:MAG: SAM-dependent methyltransferase, partial [Chitinophagales bacterium]|nr:SAM-dependent methyltransferase [Chitinophagales bacterium]